MYDNSSLYKPRHVISSVFVEAVFMCRVCAPYVVLLTPLTASVARVTRGVWPSGLASMTPLCASQIRIWQHTPRSLNEGTRYNADMTSLLSPAILPVNNLTDLSYFVSNVFCLFISKFCMLFCICLTST